MNIQKITESLKVFFSDTKKIISILYKDREEFLLIYDKYKNSLKGEGIDFTYYPFISERAALIYYLTELEGKQRKKALGITNKHYEDKDEAKKWRKIIAQKIHSDRIEETHPDKEKSNKAFVELEAIYNNMIDYEDDNE